MKIIIYLFILSFLTLTSNSQSLQQFNKALSPENTDTNLNTPNYKDYHQLILSLKNNSKENKETFQKLDSLELQNYQDDDTYETTQCRKWEYNLKGQIISYQYDKKITDIGMRLYFKIDYTYDYRGDKITKRYYRPRENDQLIEQYNNTYKWDNEHQIIEDTYNVVGFDIRSKTNYSWNAENQLLLIDKKDWDYTNQEWVNDEQEIFNYNAEGNLESVLNRLWLKDSNEWKDMKLYEYSYNNDQALVQRIVYRQYIDTDYWEKDHRLDFYYNEHGYKKEEVEFYGSLQNDTLPVQNKKEYTTDEYGNTIASISYEWQDYDELWLEKAKDIPDYNFNYQRDEILIPEDYDLFTSLYEYHDMDNAQNMWISSTISWYHAETKGWDIKGQTLLHYTEINVSAIKLIENSSTYIYPNPVNNSLVINTNEFMYSEIYSQAGQKVLSTVNSKINVSQLEQGVYFIKIVTTDKKTEIKKFIKL